MRVKYMGEEGGKGYEGNSNFRSKSHLLFYAKVCPRRYTEEQNIIPVFFWCGGDVERGIIIGDKEKKYQTMHFGVEMKKLIKCVIPSPSPPLSPMLLSIGVEYPENRFF